MKVTLQTSGHKLVSCSFCHKDLLEFALQIIGKSIVTVCPECQVRSVPAEYFVRGKCSSATGQEPHSFTCNRPDDEEWHLAIARERKWSERIQKMAEEMALQYEAERVLLKDSNVCPECHRLD